MKFGKSWVKLLAGNVMIGSWVCRGVRPWCAGERVSVLAALAVERGVRAPWRIGWGRASSMVESQLLWLDDAPELSSIGLVRGGGTGLVSANSWSRCCWSDTSGEARRGAALPRGTWTSDRPSYRWCWCDLKANIDAPQSPGSISAADERQLNSDKDSAMMRAPTWAPIRDNPTRRRLSTWLPGHRRRRHRRTTLTCTLTWTTPRTSSPAPPTTSTTTPSRCAIPDYMGATPSPPLFFRPKPIQSIRLVLYLSNLLCLLFYQQFIYLSFIVYVFCFQQLFFLIYVCSAFWHLSVSICHKQLFCWAMIDQRQ